MSKLGRIFVQFASAILVAGAPAGAGQGGDQRQTVDEAFLAIEGLSGLPKAGPQWLMLPLSERAGIWLKTMHGLTQYSKKETRLTRLGLWFVSTKDRTNPISKPLSLMARPDFSTEMTTTKMAMKKSLEVFFNEDPNQLAKLSPANIDGLVEKYFQEFGINNDDIKP